MNVKKTTQEMKITVGKRRERRGSCNFFMERLKKDFAKWRLIYQLKRRKILTQSISSKSSSSHSYWLLNNISTKTYKIMILPDWTVNYLNNTKISWVFLGLLFFLQKERFRYVSIWWMIAIRPYSCRRSAHTRPDLWAWLSPPLIFLQSHIT